MRETRLGFLDSWKKSQDALNLLESANALFQRARAESDLQEIIRLQTQAIHLEKKALQLFGESDCFHLQRIEEQKAEIEEQKAKLLNREEPTT